MTRERVSIAPTVSDPAALGRIVERARRRGFHSFVVPRDAQLSLDPTDEVIRREGDRLFPPGRETTPVPVVPIADEETLRVAVRGMSGGGVLAIEWASDRVIPLENAIAARGRQFELWVVARDPSEVPAALGALEHGADRVLVEVHAPEGVDQLEHVVDGPLPSDLAWASLPLTEIRPVGVGDRVLVDTTSLLRPEEGLLVGSVAAFLFHVASEAVGSRFSRPRPFRVNAGAAHSYVLMADGSTRYLSELGPGDAVLVTVPRGTARAVRVGRVKIERRPLDVLVAGEGEDRRTVFLQEAETVRVSTEAGRVASTDIDVGARVLGVRLPAARHLGHAIEETINER